MACGGCGAKYRGVSRLSRPRNLPVKYQKVKPAKPAKPIKVVPPAVPKKKLNPQTAIGLMSSVASNVFK